MSSNKIRQVDIGRKPDNMVTPVVSLRDLGRMIASKHDLPTGHYELVVEYKFGPSRLQEPDGSGAISAMAISFGGLGLRTAEKPSPMTIDVSAAPTKRSAPKKKSTQRKKHLAP